MKKADLVDAITSKTGVGKVHVEQVIEEVFEQLTQAMTRGERVDLRGFGTFNVKDSAARTGRNPQTGEAIQIPARRVPGFKAGKELKERVNNKT
jgi:DNA-binding protein HU-beta